MRIYIEIDDEFDFDWIHQESYGIGKTYFGWRDGALIDSYDTLLQFFLIILFNVQSIRNIVQYGVFTYDKYT